MSVPSLSIFPEVSSRVDNSRERLCLPLLDTRIRFRTHVSMLGSILLSSRTTLEARRTKSKILRSAL